MSDAELDGPLPDSQPDVVETAAMPPDSPREAVTVPVDPEPRHFEADGKSWIARVAGKGAAGTGAYGLGLIEAIHFFAAESPDRPVLEALLARNRFSGLFEKELIELWQRATPIVIPEDR